MCDCTDDHYCAECSEEDDAPVPMNNPVVDYWHEHYVHKGHCALCGNHGRIDTTGTKTPAGLLIGKKLWCICPNGQTLRHHYGGDGPK